MDDITELSRELALGAMYIVVGAVAIAVPVLLAALIGWVIVAAVT